MKALDFLQLVWPSTGHYCIAWPFVGTDNSRPRMGHKVFDTIEAAATFCDQQKDTADMYFCVHSLRERRRWNERKKNWKTQELGAWEIRVQANMGACKVLFLDIDVKPNVERHYQSAVEALKALQAFCIAIKLPKPCVVSSGNGLHIYWLFTEDIATEQWLPLAAKLKQLVEIEGLLADPVVINDSARVLRVVGTLHRKNPENIRPVQMLQVGVATAAEDIEATLNAALIARGRDTANVSPAAIKTVDLGDIESNVKPTYQKVSPAALLKTCAQIREVALLKGNVPEPLWYHSLNIVRFLENGQTIAHKISEGHPSYSAAETDAKLEQLEAKNVGPSSCATISSASNNELCKSCPHFAAAKNPLIVSKVNDTAPAPKPVALVVGQITPALPQPPKPYVRLKTGEIAMTSKDAEGNETTTTLLPYDLYPVDRVSDTNANSEQQLWHAKLPRGVQRSFEVPADAVYDRRKLAFVLSNQGIYPQYHQLDAVRDFMIAYITELQRVKDSEIQHRHLGWTEDYKKFVLPGYALADDGSMVQTSITATARAASDMVRKEGTLERQIELLKFYNTPAYVAQQFFVLAGLAAPIYYMTGQHGVIINASGDPGTSKSTSLYAAASLWGVPTTYPINGTNRGATANARTERITALANLPVCVDEITHMPHQDAVNFAMSVTQPNGRDRVDKNGKLITTTEKGKSTIVLTTANSSLHSLLSHENSAAAAGSMRVFEVPYLATLVHKKFEAEEFLRELSHNYGHVGPAVTQYVVQNQSTVGARLREIMREIDTNASVTSAERFWTAAIASVLCIGEIANKLNILFYDVGLIRKWAVETMIPSMRTVIADEYATPLSILTDYIVETYDNLVVTADSGVLAKTELRNRPRRVLGHYDQTSHTLWLLRKGFKDYCTKIGANDRQILQDLNTPKMGNDGQPIRIVPHIRVKKVLGANTDYATAQVWCCVVDMSHPEVTDITALKVLSNNSKTVKKA